MSQFRQTRKQSRPGRLWLLFGLLLGLGWNGLAAPQPVTAHALLVRSIPEANADLSQPPPQIELWFSEPLEDGFNQVRLLTSTGQNILAGPVVLDPADRTHLIISLEPLEPGIYTVAWQNLSRIDGHAWTGSFPFTVLNPDGSRPTSSALPATAGERSELPAPAEILARWLGLLGGCSFGAHLSFGCCSLLCPNKPRLINYLPTRVTWPCELSGWQLWRYC